MKSETSNEVKGIKQMNKEMTDFTKTGVNTYKDADGKLYRFSSYGVTPNGCWHIMPVMTELLDINIATGKDILGKAIGIGNGIGTVQAY